MNKAIRITKSHLDTIVAETGIKKEALEVLATEGETFLVIGTDIIHGQQTYHQTIFREKFSYIGNADPRQFNEVVFK